LFGAEMIEAGQAFPKHKIDCYIFLETYVQKHSITLEIVKIGEGKNIFN
jgi:hypothetical protein